MSYGTRVWRWGGGVALFCTIVRSRKASLPLHYTGNSGGGAGVINAGNRGALERLKCCILYFFRSRFYSKILDAFATLFRPSCSLFTILEQNSVIFENMLDFVNQPCNIVLLHKSILFAIQVFSFSHRHAVISHRNTVKA